MIFIILIIELVDYFHEIQAAILALVYYLKFLKKRELNYGFHN